ncbi:hypothetical protein [Janthinobacterium sp. HLX7-2]|uniref:hypothetical protein n=1 Tax=Janthinobacterium sp. HLX7-2 TaxID=1259331 RepID=UPI003F269978
MKNKLKLLAALALTSGATLPAFAVDPDLTSLTSVVSFTTVLAGVIAIAVGVAGVYLLIRGVKILLPLIRG